MQVYRRMDIGTAKATAEERAAAPHHMLDVAEPWEDYSVARYVEAAAACCDDILRRGKLPIIVGGTGLYIDSLLSGRDFAAREEGTKSSAPLWLRNMRRWAARPCSKGSAPLTRSGPGNCTRRTSAAHPGH